MNDTKEISDDVQQTGTISGLTTSRKLLVGAALLTTAAVSATSGYLAGRVEQYARDIALANEPEHIQVQDDMRNLYPLLQSVYELVYGKYANTSSEISSNLEYKPQDLFESVENTQ